jgi:hypothetical protein
MKNFLKKFFNYCENVGIAFDRLVNASFLAGDKDETVSLHAALDARAGRRWACVFCRVLSVLVQRNHCADQFLPGTSTPATFIRAGISFAAAFTILWLLIRSITGW